MPPDLAPEPKFRGPLQGRHQAYLSKLPHHETLPYFNELLEKIVLSPYNQTLSHIMKTFRSARDLLRPISASGRYLHRASRIQSSILAASKPSSQRLHLQQQQRPWVQSLYYSSGRSTADTLAEDLQQIYAEAKDEFEIATESTEARAIYAAEDRQAARDELVKLQEAYQKALEGEAGEELRKRPIGQRIRELEAAIEELNKADYED